MRAKLSTATETAAAPGGGKGGFLAEAEAGPPVLRERRVLFPDW